MNGAISLSISIPDLVTVRAHHPEAIAEAAARRVRRPLSATAAG